MVSSALLLQSCTWTGGPDLTITVVLWFAERGSWATPLWAAWPSDETPPCWERSVSILQIGQCCCHLPHRSCNPPLLAPALSASGPLGASVGAGGGGSPTGGVRGVSRGWLVRLHGSADPQGAPRLPPHPGRPGPVLTAVTGSKTGRTRAELRLALVPCPFLCSCKASPGSRGRGKLCLLVGAAEVR